MAPLSEDGVADCGAGRAVCPPLELRAYLSLWSSESRMSLRVVQTEDLAFISYDQLFLDV